MQVKKCLGARNWQLQGWGDDTKGGSKGCINVEDFQLIHDTLEDPSPEYGDLIEIKVRFLISLDTFF